MSHANEFWNFDNADRDENGKFLPLFPHNLGRALHHPEQDYNANLIGQIIKGYRVIGSGAEGEMTTSDLELGVRIRRTGCSSFPVSGVCIFRIVQKVCSQEHIPSILPCRE